MEEARIQLELNPFVTDVLRSQVHIILDDLSPRIHIPEYILEEDLDMAAVWQKGLKESLQSDCQSLLTILEEDIAEENNVIDLSMDQAYGIVRACTAIRLKIQDSYLAEIKPEELEQGEVNFDELSEETRRSYLTFSVLASLQTAILDAIDPDLSSMDL